MHGPTQLTGDRYLLWDGTPDEAHALREALALCGCTELPDVDRPQVGYRATGASGDLCAPALPWGAMDVTHCLTSAETTRDPEGFSIRYAALDDLIRMRRALGRPKDQRRAEELARLRT
ncbi:hypothetical protein [Streptomyces sp. NPDC001348]